MRPKVLFPFLIISVCAFSAAAQQVDESASSIVFTDKTAELSLAIDNQAEARNLDIDLQILDADGKTTVAAAPTIRLRHGRRVYKVSFQIGELLKTAGGDLAWYRLSYRIGESTGLVSLSELLKDDFELRAVTLGRLVPGQPFLIKVRTLHPLTKRSIKQVRISGEVDLDLQATEKKLAVKADGYTNGDGLLDLEFKVPSGIELDDDSTFTIKGSKDGVTRTINEDLDSDDIHGTVFLTADKPLYQPGQSFQARGLFLDPNNIVAGGEELDFSIEDEDDTVLFHQKVKTSDYGIASISWTIPENAKLGTYRLEVKSDDDDELRGDYLGFKVSRYDLPNFSVSASPDKAYYLPTDQQAKISITGDYLFGKPVTHGKVRIVQERDRRWNWQLQQYEQEESDEIAGETDRTGKFVANFDLASEDQKLQASKWRRYVDLHFAAYYTDLSTNRTEQKRFDIRLTKEPIHIYMIRWARQNPNLPLIAYVSTFYADGTAAVCNVEVRDENGTVSRFRTNSLGAGKFQIDIPASHAPDKDYSLRIIAVDRQGRQGTFDEDYSLNAKDDALQLSVQKTIYKPDETIEISLRSTQQTGHVYVDVIKDETVIDSQVVTLHNGKGDLSIPYRDAFKGELTIGAYGDQSGSYEYDRMIASRGIIFPEEQNLRLSTKFSQTSFRPGEDANLKFSVLDGTGRTAESALGVVVFDKAIEERARTDAEFGSYFRPYYDLMGYEKTFGNISEKDLNALDLSRPISPEMDLAAEIMLADNYYHPRVYRQGADEGDASALYNDLLSNQLKPLQDALKKEVDDKHLLPNDEAALQNLLLHYGIDLTTIRDPWGHAYVPDFSTQRSLAIVSLTSAGPNKKPGDDDDIRVASVQAPYFTSVGEMLDKAVLDYHQRTGNYVRDLTTLTSELSKFGVDLSNLKDRWGRGYRIAFEIHGNNYVIRVHSAGPDGVFQTERWGDDFDVWTNYIDYFYESGSRLNQILNLEVNNGKKPFPKDEKEFSEMLKRNGFDLNSTLDAYGRPVYLSSRVQARYVDKTTYENGKQIIKPVTDELKVFSIRSKGADPIDPSDDFDLASFSSVISTSGIDGSKAVANSVAFSGAKGAMHGTVTDPMGAVIPGAVVVATDQSFESKTYSATTNSGGEFLLENLPSGQYRLSISSPGFKSLVRTNVEVRSQNLIELTITLSVGSVSAVVDVTSNPAETINASDVSVSTTTKRGGAKIQLPQAQQNSTPRLREYFPETLVWQPELITDKRGKAEMTFKMADNITTWKMYAIASTKNGKIGIAEREITAFQPFFVDLDPPKFLTQGDEISLPVQIRNYTDKNQSVAVTMDEGSWFSMLGPSKQQVDVAAGESQNAIFGFRATMATREAKQRVTAAAQTDSDAVEKPVTVRPNGQEVVRTESRFSSGPQKFDIAFPQNALPETQKAELKIYPNLYSHVAESIEGLLERPYGCGEQTISSTYPDLMILRFAKPDSAIATKAAKYLQAGYERLLGYQAADGGFTFWGGKDTSDVALTAYALRFLNDASSKISIDPSIAKRAQEWLVKQQRADGSWTRKYRWETLEDTSRTKLITTYVVRTMAMRADSDKAALKKGLDYLRTRNAEIDEPYALALYGLAAADAGDRDTAASVAQILEKMAIVEGGAVYWKLETNTPFYGWGTAGRIETTALVTQLLIKASQNKADPVATDLISKGMVFLLRNKDRYGVWYSTQTTVNVLDTFIATLGTHDTGVQQIGVKINGQTLEPIEAASDQVEPIDLDLAGKLSPTTNSVEITGTGGAPIMSQIVVTHYVDWKDADISGQSVNQSRALRLDYKCDQTTVVVMQEITCSVAAERIGFRGYGMLLAEIGTPPGAEVDRDSLEKAMTGEWAISHYDILPDRIVVYMWAQAGGTKFTFKFRPRYGIKAQTPASFVYDYYNPEAQATVAPLLFSVK